MRKEDAYKLGVAQTKFRKKFRRKKRWKKVVSFLLWLLILIAFISAIFISCIKVSTCTDNGMIGTIPEGNIVLTNKLSFMLRNPERGEVITLKTKDDSGVRKMLQRRIIAFPNEEVEILNGAIYINGKQCEESYASDITESEVSTIVVPQGTYYVLSDARDVGPDSRNGLYVEPSDIIGTVLYNFNTDSLKDFLENIADKISGWIG